MRFSTISSPACNDRCRCGIRRASLAMASNRSSSASTESMDEMRRRSSSGTWRSRLFTSVPSLGSPGRSRAIAGDVDAGQHHLARAVLDTRVRTCSTTAPMGTERELPRPNGMMQKVQRWSQPFCTCTKARVWPRMPSMRCGAVSLTAMMSLTRTFSVSATPKSRSCRTGLGLHLLVVADDLRDLRHGGEHLGLDLRGAAGDDDAARRAFRARGGGSIWRAWRVASAVTAQVLTITDLAEPRRLRVALHRLGFGDVEPAAERDDVDAHPAASANRSGAKTRPRVRARPGRSSARGRPLSRHSMARSPPGSVTVALRPVSPCARCGHDGRAGGRAAGAGEAGAALPDAQEDMLAAR